MELCWKSCPISAIRARVGAAKFLSFSRAERKHVLVWNFSEQNEMGTLLPLSHFIWWSSCLDDPLSLVTQIKETWGFILQWKGIQGWGIPSWQPLRVPGGYFALSCWCCVTVQGSKLQDSAETSCLPYGGFGRKTKHSNNPGIRDQKPCLFNSNVFSNCQKQPTTHLSKAGSLL